MVLCGLSPKITKLNPQVRPRLPGRPPKKRGSENKYSVRGAQAENSHSAPKFRTTLVSTRKPLSHPWRKGLLNDSRTILILEPDDTVQEVVRDVILHHDLALETASDQADLERLIQKDKTFALAFNASSIRENPCDFIRRIKQIHPDLPILVILGPAFKDKMVELLQAGAYGCLETPLQAEDLSYNIVKLIANTTDTYNPFALNYEERTIMMPNEFSLVMQVAKNVADTTLPPNTRHRYHIILGLSEIINNAIEHGNLDITFEEKSSALKASRFFSLAIERANCEPFKSRQVTIRSKIFPQVGRVEYHISDEGRGFDWRLLPNPRDKENMLNRNGRGIMMARYAFDEMRFNETGNQVTLVVNLNLPYRGRRAQ